MQMGSLHAKDGGGFKKNYTYNPLESVGVKCVATTFFSRDAKVAPVAADKTKKGK
jgi:hypothetical protein